MDSELKTPPSLTPRLLLLDESHGHRPNIADLQAADTSSLVDLTGTMSYQLDDFRLQYVP